MLGGPLTASPDLGFKPVDQIDDSEEPGAGVAMASALTGTDSTQRTGWISL